MLNKTHPIKTNILITNTMRSGSSYLSRIISAHSKVSMTYDTLNFFRFGYGRYDDISDCKNFTRLITDFAFRLKNRFEININVDMCLSQANGQQLTYALANSLILRQIYPNPQKTYLGDQESLVWTKIPRYLEMYENGKIIIIARDPRDVVNSFRKITIAPGSDYLIALFNAIDIVDKGMRYAEKHPNKVHFLTFENLKLHTEREVRKIASFLDLDFEDQMLDSGTYTDHFGKPWNDSKSRSWLDEQNPMAAVGRWKSNIDPVDLFLAEWLGENQVKQMGLKLSKTKFNQDTFEEGIRRLMSSPLLKEAFHKLICSGEGSEKFPLNPTDPSNWDPKGVKNKMAFQK